MPRPKLVRSLIAKVKEAGTARRKRRIPTGFGFALADRIGYFDPARWGAATSGSSLFLGRDYLQALEGAAPDNLRSRYALIFRGAEPVAAVAAQVVEVEAGRWMRAPGRGLVRKLAAGMKSRLLVCGNLLSWGRHGVAFAPGADRGALWPAVAEAIHRLRRAEKLAGDADLILLKDFAGDEDGALRPFAYRPLETEPDMVLDLAPAWKGYADYLSSLSSSYRRSARKVAREIEEAGGRVERLADLDAHAERLHALYRKVHEGAAVRPVTIARGYLPALARALGERFRCAAVRRGGEILGFAVTLKDGETAVGYTMGFDREAHGELPVYVRLLHAVVEDAIALGCRRLSLGRTALDAKARLGAKPSPLHVWVRHRHPLLNLLVRGLLGAVPHEEAPERNPFKGGDHEN